MLPEEASPKPHGSTKYRESALNLGSTAVKKTNIDHANDFLAISKYSPQIQQWPQEFHSIQFFVLLPFTMPGKSRGSMNLLASVLQIFDSGCMAISAWQSQRNCYRDSIAIDIWSELLYRF